MIPSRTVRKARGDDIEQCVALALDAAPERDASAWRDSLRRDVENRDHCLLVAESDGLVVGYGRARHFKPPLGAPADEAPAGYYLTGLFVTEGARRTGLGAALTQARLEWIGDLAAEAWFFANARNTASIALHGRFGFEEVTRLFSFPGVTFEGGEGILFRLRLGHPAQREPLSRQGSSEPS